MEGEVGRQMVVVVVVVVVVAVMGREGRKMESGKNEHGSNR